MSDTNEQIERVTGESDVPADITEEKPLAPDLPPDRTRQFAQTSFSRMRTGWRGEDREMIMQLQVIAGQFIEARFSSAYVIIAKMRRLVRQRAADSSGEALFDSDGGPLWVRDEYGEPAEDWSRLTDRDRNDLLYSLATRLHEWKMLSVDAWAEAMVSKVQWEELFASGFTAIPPGVVSGKPTIDDRTQWGHKTAIEERYHAVFRSALSRRAQGIVESMERLYYLLDKHPG